MMTTVWRVTADSHSNHNLPIGAEVRYHAWVDGVTYYTQGGNGDEVAIDSRDLEFAYLIDTETGRRQP